MKGRGCLPFRASLGITGSPRPGSRVGWLTPYEVEILRSEARRAGPGAQLDLFLPARASEEGVAWVRSELEPLRAVGIEVAVKRDSAWEFREVDPAPRAVARVRKQ